MAEGMAYLNLVLLGKTGTGKSSSGNTILGRDAFQSKKASTSVTRDVAVESGIVDGIPVTVYDTPGLFNTDMRDEEIQQMINEKVLQKCESGRCVFLLVIKADRFTEEEIQTVEKIEELLRPKRLEKTWILFTGGDELEEDNMTIKELINYNQLLKNVVQKYDQRYHVFNNKKRQHTEVNMLLKTCLHTMEKGATPKGTLVESLEGIPGLTKHHMPEMTRRRTRVISLSRPRRIMKPMMSCEDNICPDMSLVLFGNSSSVKFGPENILLGEKQTNMENSAILRISPLQRKISEHHVSVINMIDLHESKHLIDKLVNEKEIHAFIFVVRLDQLTDDDKMGLEWLQRAFGDTFLQFVMILFTYETEEESDTIIDDLKKNPVLEQLLEKSGGRFHTCNKRMNNQSEMRDLMNKIELLFNENKQQSYTAEMFNTASIRSKELENSQCESGHKSDMDPNAHLILLGKTKVGKSASGNTILGRQAFVSKKSSTSVTRDIAVESGTVDGFPVTVYDTPGLFNTDMRDEEIQQMINEKVLQKCGSGRCVFLLVIKADSFTEEEIQTVEKIEELLGEERLKKTWILFTRGDELEDENMTIKEFINDTEPLKKLLQKYDQRYHVFNNKNSGSTDQARLLLATILQRSLEVKYEERRIPDSRAKAHIEPDTPAASPSSRRIVLLGKTGFGKSASGNTILGQKEFNSEQSSSSVTRKCSEKHATVSGRSVSVVDTPGFFDTDLSPDELMTEIARSVYISSPGPHAFLIVLRVNDRFTKQDQHIPQMIEMMFGERVLKYSFILFTHGDLVKRKSINELIMENCRLRHLVQRCESRYHVFNNRDVNNRDQVNDLLKKIDTMIQENGGGHYSNQMYEDAERLRRVEEKRGQTEEDERKEQEKQRQDETERARKENGKIPEEIEAKRSERERLEAEKQREEEKRKHVKGNELEDHKPSNKERPRKTPEFEEFYQKYQSRWKRTAFAFGYIAIGELIGACIGGAIGLMGGPVGAVAGVDVGLTAGAAVGAAAGVAVFNWLDL